jgi:hypothetical protein
MVGLLSVLRKSAPDTNWLLSKMFEVKISRRFCKTGKEEFIVARRSLKNTRIIRLYDTETSATSRWLKGSNSRGSAAI